MVSRRSACTPATLRGHRSRLADRRRRAARSERGAVLVETALILPLVFLLLFGIIEFSLAYRSSANVSAAVRSGVRTASAISSTSNASFYSITAAAVGTALTKISSDTPIEMWIYRAEADGNPLNGNSFSTCTGACARYTWNGSTFVAQNTPSWARTACLTSSSTDLSQQDTVGVWLKVQHNYLTGLLKPITGASVMLTDKALARLEPQPAASCVSAP